MFRNREDVFVAMDLLWYPVKGKPKIRLAPDVLVALGRPKGPRRSSSNRSKTTSRRRWFSRCCPKPTPLPRCARSSSFTSGTACKVPLARRSGASRAGSNTFPLAEPLLSDDANRHTIVRYRTASPPNATHHSAYARCACAKNHSLRYTFACYGEPARTDAPIRAGTVAAT
jgi:hypothetical protein